ncbi:hypothetical protein GOB57_09710 [Sinorhizobium meliloti]|nr:hypothetical protein [Sinorhizobium meliloti]
MKLTMEIQGLYTGVSPHSKKPDEMVTWTAVWGTDNNGRYARASAYGTVAIALNKAINATLGENENVSSKRIVVTLNGEWQSRKVMKNGKEETQRSFFPKESENSPAFTILDGMALEAARLRNDAAQALRKAEKLRSGGQLALAYEAVAQFVANYAGVPLELEKFLADSAADDLEFGATANVEADPEEAAAAHFAREDRVKDVAADAVAPSEEPSVEADAAVAEEEAQDPMDFGADDEVLGAVDAAEANDSVVEEDAIVIDASLAGESDVLEDAPADVPSAPPASGSSAFASRPSGFQTQPTAASKPFSRPEPVRQAPQPVARPVPAASDRPTPPPFSAPRGPRF